MVPNTSITSGPTVTRLATAAFGFTSDAGDATFECDLDGGGYSACTSPRQYTGLAEGSHTFSVRATDSAQHLDASPATRTVVVDRTAPTTTDDVPAPRQTSPVRVTLTAGDNSGGAGIDKTFYEVGASPATPTTSSPVYNPANKPVLQDGQSIKYFSADLAGNAEAVRTSANTASVDAVAPTTTHDVPSAHQATPVVVTLTATDNAGGFGVDKTYYEVGATPAAPTTGSPVYSDTDKPVLQDGESIRYFSTDKGGNTEPLHWSIAARVDEIAPTTTDDVPSAPQPANVRVTLTAADNPGGVGVEKTFYEVGADPATPTTSSPVYDASDKPLLGDGERIAYFSRDALGNAEAPKLSAHAARVDAVAPSITLTAPVEFPGYSRHAVVPAAYSCADDSAGAGIASCVGTVPDGDAIPTSAIGEHRFTVTAIDAAGNTTTRTVTYTVLDVTAPAALVSTPADGASYDRGATVAADYGCADEGGGSGVESCVGTVADGASIDTDRAGPHSFTVTATDAAGNVRTETVSYTVRDITAPTLEVQVPAVEGSYGRGRTVAADYSCADEDGGAGLASCEGDVPSGEPLDTSTLGAHTFTVTATDRDGNQTTRTITYRVRDVTAPVIAIARPADDATFAQGASVGRVSFGCTDDDGGSGLATCTGTIPDGTAIDTSRIGRFTIKVTATDNAGNTTSDRISYSVGDVTPPSIEVSRPQGRPTYPFGARVQPQFRCSDGEGGSGVVSCEASEQALRTRTPGLHRIVFTAIDRAGNFTREVRAYRVAAPPVKLRSLSASPTAFTPRGRSLGRRGSARSSMVRYAVTRAAKLTLTFTRRSPRGRVTRRFTTTRRVRAGQGIFRFDGRRAGRPLPAGQWRLAVVATDSDGNSTPRRSVRFRLR